MCAFCRSNALFLTSENFLPSAIALYAAPIKAAPATCMMMVRVSATIKTASMLLGVTKRGRSCTVESERDEVAASMDSVRPR